jgi:hypothetical protein
LSVTELTAVDSNLWWLSAPKDDKDPTGAELARNIGRVATARERADIPRRFKNLTYFRHFTGRPVIGTYAYGMAKRPSNFVAYYGDSEFSPPRYNLIGTCADVYVTRLLVHETYVEFVPEDGNNQQRMLSQDIADYIEGGFTELGYWEARKAMGINALAYGSGFLKWAESYDEQPEVTAPSPDELLFANYDDPDPREYLHRIWAFREDVLDRYGTNPEARAAILNAPHCEEAFYFGPGKLATGDIIPLIYGLRARHAGKGDDRKPGREVLCVGNYTIFDRPWEDDDTNLVKYDFTEVPSALFGSGISELLLAINEEMDEYLAVEQESFLRSGAGKWLYDEAGNVNPDDLGDTVAGAVSVAPGARYPEYVTPDPITERGAERFERMAKLGMKRVHISENAVVGETPKALTSSVALESWAKIDDVNFAEKIARLEKVDLKSAYQLLRLAKKLKPSFTRPGSSRQVIKWSKLQLTDRTVVGLKGFNVGRLGQTYSGKEQTVNAMLASGSIDRATANKYLQVPDTQRMLDQLNAPETLVDDAIDELLFAKEYLPPPTGINLDYAKQAVEARIGLEEQRIPPEERAKASAQAPIDNLRMWRAAILEMKQQQVTPDPNGAPAALPPSAPGAPAGTDADIPGPQVPVPQQLAA